MKDILDNQYIVVGLFTLLGTIIGGFLVPWYKYFLDIRKELRDDRKKLLDSLRLMISKKEFSREGVINTPEYSKIRQHLSKKFTDEFESSNAERESFNLIIGGFKGYFLNELSDIEAEWGVALNKKKGVNNEFNTGIQSYDTWLKTK